VALRRFEAVEIVPQLRAPGNDAEQTTAGQQIALTRRVEILDGAAQLREIGAHTVIGIDRADRPVQEMIAAPRRRDSAWPIVVSASTRLPNSGLLAPWASKSSMNRSALRSSSWR
jgi:hypothetical protein